MDKILYLSFNLLEEDTNSGAFIYMERHKIIDTLRGFSLFGILIVHLPLLGSSHFLFMDLESAKGVGEKISYLLYYIFFEAKLFPIFSFLFGYGFALQLQGKAGIDSSLFLKRLLGLAILGILHNILFFNGDILFTYACLGLLLYFLRNQSEKILLTVSIVSLLFSSVTFYIIGSTPVTEGELQKLIQDFKTSNQLNFIESVYSRIHSGIEIFPFVFLNNWPTSFAMLGLGFTVGKRNALTDENLLKKIPSYFSYLALGIGTIGGLCMVFEKQLGISKGIGMSIFALASPFLSFFYIYSLLKIVKKNLFVVLTDLFSRNGKMSLSIYISESILMGILFQAWGLGLFDKLQVHELLLMSIPAYLFLSILATLWLKKFEIGPFEWIFKKFVKIITKSTN
jgi:uncharacterized protein